ncbi:Fe3+-hydroxamate ABC transporter permease FhuB [Terasakiispira papahanaumokuakeensis]|uniref:Fe3+-hydroxamate ABC transporter permease FhuB n=1 Tax=Terasakiispira papahanaumokuakeensis TaxID=197479 RepID=A0A1E2VEN6_9GAMM|nr:Fe(3+)-hydroxamate ABC transporter permease FhuB [Terasakiispira papahanaumokuakeensis]ODC05470.1 Fe3+-hydroxamate ABC transporter permease FhuB [Terasakiispira papahanaumokuakeensis]
MKRHRWLLNGGLLLSLIVLVAQTLAPSQAPLTSLWSAQAAPLLHYSWWPRLFMALLVGASLGVAGVLMQQVLRNPLATPLTLGVSSGASLALMSATLMAPSVLLIGREWIATLGGFAAMGLVLMLAWRRQLAPVVVVLAGLVINLYAGALSLVLLLFNQEALSGMMVWGAGSMAQNGWHDLNFLWPRLLGSVLVLLLLYRALNLLELDDASIKSLGVPVRPLRLAGLGLAVFITACSVSVVGVIGFVGLAAPALARLTGARTLGQRLWQAPLLGALLLAVTDQLLQALGHLTGQLMATGAITAMIGAPLLLWLLPRLSLPASRPSSGDASEYRHRHPRRLHLLILILLIIAMVLALGWGQLTAGWQWSLAPEALTWRWPRMLGAAAGGILLALAGTVIQRMTANPMASPEVLGISSGSAMGLMLTLLFWRGATTSSLIIAGTLGALIALGLLVALNRRHDFQPARLLLTGVAMAALFDGLRTLVLANGDPRGQQILAWISGSTYYLSPTSAITAMMLALLMLGITLLLARWLDIMPLGSATASALGLGMTQARLTLLLLVALLTAVATLMVGPLSFVGLLAPHMARLMGWSRGRDHLLGAALMGAVLMVVADWLGRQLLFPQELPAGIVATLIGGLYFMWGLKRSQ